MGQNLSRRFDLLENVWLDASCPVVVFIHHNTYANAEGIEIIKKELLNAKILEISNVKELEGNIVFKMFIKGYFVNCRLNTRYYNLIITSTRRATAGKKIEFIESHRRIINVEEHGVIFSIHDEDVREHIVEPLDKANKMKLQYGLTFNDNMPAEAFKELSDYICAEAKEKTVIEAKHFDEKYLKTVSDFASLEYQAEQADIDEAFGITYISRRSVKIAGDNSQKYIYEFICPYFDTEDYPPGTEIAITCEGSSEKKRAFGSIVNIEDDAGEDEQKKVTVTFKNQFSDEEIPMSGGEIKKVANTCQKNVRDRVVAAFREKSVRAEYMYETFNDPTVFPTKGFDTSIDMKPIYADMKKRGILSNEKQCEAIRKGIQTKDIALVLGPPGTGKTTVIVEWALYYIKQKKRILISSKNNKAVDNVFERIVELKEDEAFLREHPEFASLGMLRIGNVDKIQQRVRDYLPENQHDAIQTRILGAAAKWDEKLLHDTQAVEEAIKCLNRERDNLMKFFESQRQMENIYKQVRAKALELISLDRKLEKLKADHMVMVEQAAEKKIYLEENAKKNFLLRLIRKRATALIEKEYEELTNKIKNINEKQYDEYIRQYNQAAQELISTLKSEKLAGLKKICSSLEAELSQNLVIEIKPQMPFDPISYSFSKDEEAYAKFKLKLDEFDRRIYDIKATMTEWRNAVSDKNNSVLSSILISNASVVGATCIGINSNRRFVNVDFDVAIIDEAGQIQIHDAIVPMSRAEKTLMLGDYLQIPPNVNEELRTMCVAAHCDVTLLEQSFFEYLYNQSGFPRDNTVMLDTQFRMPSQVADILSYQFYSGNYKSADFKKGMKSLCPEVFKSPLVIVDTSDSEKRRERVDGPNKYNPYEAEMIVKLLEKLGFGTDSLQIELEDIGIIAPLKRQKTAIQEAVKKRFPYLSKAQIEAMIATLDSFQGQERSLIVYSCTRSNTRNQIGFLTELRRLNVALSRCKKQIVIIGDFDFLTTCTDNPNEEFGFVDEDEEPDVIEVSAEVEAEDDSDDGSDFGLFGLGKKVASQQKSNDKPKPTQSEPSLALTRTTKRFSEFMKYLLDDVKKGHGEYIKSKDFGA